MWSRSHLLKVKCAILEQRDNVPWFKLLVAVLHSTKGTMVKMTDEIDSEAQIQTRITAIKL